MRLRRDRRNYQHVAAWMERINLVRSERARELSRVNKSLYEFLHADEGRPTDDPVINHTVIKADVRGSTGITKDLLAKGLNPASHFSMNLHEPVKRMLERFGAATVFIEGDAIILAIYETESTRATTPRRRPRLHSRARNPRRHPGLQRAHQIHRPPAARTRCRRGFPGFRSFSLDGRRIQNHDFPRPEPVRPSFQLHEDHQAPLPE